MQCREPLDSITVGQGILQGLAGEDGKTTGGGLSDALDRRDNGHHSEIAALSHLPPEDTPIDLLGNIAVRYRGTLKDDATGTRKILKPGRFDFSVRQRSRPLRSRIFRQGRPTKPLGQMIAEFLGRHLVRQVELSFEPMLPIQLESAVVTKGDR